MQTQYDASVVRTRHPGGGNPWYSSRRGFLVDGYAVSVIPSAASPAPLPIPEVETGTIRNGYVIVTPDAGTAIPTGNRRSNLKSPLHPSLTNGARAT